MSKRGQLVIEKAPPRTVQTFTDLYKGLLQRLTYYSQDVSARGLTFSEQVGETLVLGHSAIPLVFSKERRLSLPMAVAEMAWYFSGSNKVDDIARHNASWKKFSKDGIVDGAYGPIIVKSLPKIVSMLKADAGSRQAIMVIHKGIECYNNPVDIPCTICMQFLIRKEGLRDTLKMIVFMRSNDVWLGTPYDVFHFKAIQALVANELKLPVGTYTHIAGSMHLYDTNEEGAQKVMLEQAFDESEYDNSFFASLNLEWMNDFGKWYLMRGYKDNEKDCFGDFGYVLQARSFFKGGDKDKAMGLMQKMKSKSLQWFLYNYMNDWK